MHYLLTGATGYLGKHVLARLLGEGHRVTVIVRAREGRLQERLVAALRPLELAAQARELPWIEILAGDVCQPDCGLTARAVATLADCDIAGFIHCAGLTRFDAHLAEDLRRHNLDGTAHAHLLCARLGIARFHHLSTAFVAGTTRQVFAPTDRDVGQAFNNPYEASKFAAECLLAERAADGGPAVTIYRPSIVVGGHALGENNSVSTVYTFIKALHFLRACCRRDGRRGSPRLAAQGVVASAAHCHIPLRIDADPALRLHLVHMDDVVDGIVAGLADAGRCTTRHLTGVPVSLATLREGICRALEVSGPELRPAGDDSAPPRSQLEAQFQRITRVYQPYLQHAPRFAPVSGGRPRAIDVHAFTRAFLAQLDGPDPRRDSHSVGALALAVAGVQQPADYFRALTEGAVGRHFLARHDFVDIRVAFRIQGEHGCAAVLHISRGRARLVDAGDAFASDCVFSLDERLFMRIVAGNADLRTAFFAGKVRIDGNKELALKFGALLGMYYRDIDEHVIDEVAV